jgi:hypothetical protein
VNKQLVQEHTSTKGNGACVLYRTVGSLPVFLSIVQAALSFHCLFPPIRITARNGTLGLKF